MACQPVFWSYWTAQQFAAAVGATPTERAFSAVAAKRAFKRTYASVKRVGRQISVAAFAVGPQFEHANQILDVNRASCARRLALASGIRYDGRPIGQIGYRLAPSHWNVR
jgi:hypothetical protein